MPDSGAALSHLVDATVVWEGGTWLAAGGLQGTAFCILQAVAGGDRVSLGMDRNTSVLREVCRCSGCFLGSKCEWHQVTCILGACKLPWRFCELQAV